MTSQLLRLESSSDLRIWNGRNECICDSRRLFLLDRDVTLLVFVLHRERTRGSRVNRDSASLVLDVVRFRDGNGLPALQNDQVGVPTCSAGFILCHPIVDTGELLQGSATFRDADPRSLINGTVVGFTRVFHTVFHECALAQVSCQGHLVGNVLVNLQLGWPSSLGQLR